MSEMLLLGAGASVEAGVPGAFDMTKKIISQLRADGDHPKVAHLLSFVAGGLLFEAGKGNRDPFSSGVNVEDLFNAVQLLAERNDLEAAPFVGAWHPTVEEFDKTAPSRTDTSRVLKAIYKEISERIQSAFEERPSAFDSRRIDDALASVLHSRGSYGRSVGEAVERYLKETAERWSRRLRHDSPHSNFELDQEMRRLLDNQAVKPARGQLYQQATKLMTAELKNLVWIDAADRVSHLAPIINLLKSQGRLAIATLNYDNGVELLASTHGVGCDTGIDAWSTGGEATFAKQDIALLKLHGSIDWTWEEGNRTQTRPMPHRLVRRVESSQLKDSRTIPCVIFGQRNKLTAEGPFLDLLRAFQRELAQTRTLTIIGYSFRDPHINVFISHWLNGQVDRVLRVVNGPNFVTGARDVDFGRNLLELITFAPSRIKIVPEYAGPGLKALYGELSRSSA